MKSLFLSILRACRNAIFGRKEYLPRYKRQFLAFGKESVVFHPANIPDRKFIAIGSNVTILPNARMQVYNALTGGNANITIGNNCYIGASLSVLAGANITIGNDVLIASDVLITSENHGMDVESDMPYMSQRLECRPVSIGDGCWIGEKAVILPGVTIGRKCIIGASAVVTKDIPDYSVAVGVPAKVIRTWDFRNHIWKVADE